MLILCLTYLVISKTYVHVTRNWDGQVHLVKDKTGGQQGDPLEMLIFNLTIHHLWGQVLPKFEETRTVGHTDDGYIKVKLSVVLQVLVDLKTVFKTGTSLEFNVSKTIILPKDITQEVAFDVEHSILTTGPRLKHLTTNVTLPSFCPEGFIGIGVYSG